MDNCTSDLGQGHSFCKETPVACASLLKLSLLGTNMSTLSEHHIKKHLSGFIHKRLTTKHGTKSPWKPFWCRCHHRLSSPSWVGEWLDDDAGISKRWWTRVKPLIANRVDRNIKAVYVEARESYVFETRSLEGTDSGHGERDIVKQNDHSQCKKSNCCYGYKANVPQPLACNYTLVSFMHWSSCHSPIQRMHCSLTAAVAQSMYPGRCAAYEMLPHMYTKAMQQIKSRTHVADTHINHCFYDIIDNHCFLAYNQLHVL